MSNVSMHVQVTATQNAEKQDAREEAKYGTLSSRTMDYTPPKVHLRSRQYDVPLEYRDRIDDLFEEVDKLLRERFEGQGILRWQ